MGDLLGIRIYSSNFHISFSALSEVQSLNQCQFKVNERFLTPGKHDFSLQTIAKMNFFFLSKINTSSKLIQIQQKILILRRSSIRLTMYYSMNTIHTT